MPLSTEVYTISFAEQNAFFGAWLRANWFGKKNRQRFLIYGTAICVVSALSLVSALKSRAGGPDFWIFALSMAITSLLAGVVFSAFVVFFVSPLISYIWQAVTYPFGPMPRRQQGVSLADDGVVKTVGETQTTLAWRDVFRFAETRGTILFFTTANCAMIVPKRAFATPERAAEFASIARQRIDSAKSIF